MYQAAVSRVYPKWFRHYFPLPVLTYVPSCCLQWYPGSQGDTGIIFLFQFQRIYQAAVFRVYPEPHSDSDVIFLFQFQRMYQAAVCRGILGLKAILALFSFSNSNICSKLLFPECILGHTEILALFSSSNPNLCTKWCFHYLAACGGNWWVQDLLPPIQYQ